MAEVPREQEKADRLRKRVEDLKETVRRLTGQLQSCRETVRRLRGGVHGGQVVAEEQGTEEDQKALARQLERQRMILERDNAVARKLQESVRPLWLTDLEGVEFGAESRTGKRVGGDFYDVIRVSDTSIALLVADVSGYGLPAAVIMATARMAFHTFATMESSPKAIMEKGNKALLESTLAGHHLTAFLGLLDTEMLTLQYVNASHCPPYLIRDNEAKALDTEGLFVGMFEDAQYEQRCVQLKQDDRLFLYTDGLLRSFDSGPKEQAVKELQDFLCEHGSLSVRQLVGAVYEQVEEEPEDDVLVLSLQLARARASEKRIAIPSIPSEIARVENSVLPALSAKGYGERSLFAVKLALEEAVMNAIKHGNQLDSTRKVKIDFALEEEKLRLTVADEGEGFDPATIPDPTEEGRIECNCGRGIALMRAYMDSVTYNERGNKVTMVKYAPWHTED